MFRNRFFWYCVIALYVITAVVLVIVLSGCALSSQLIPQITTETQGLVVEQGSNIGPLDTNSLAQLVLRSEDGFQLTLRWTGNVVLVTKGQGCLWYWTSTVNNVGGTICVKNPVELVKNEITDHNPYKIPSLVTVDTYGVPLPQLPEHKYVAGIVSDFADSRVPEQAMTVPEIRGLIREVQGGYLNGVVYFPPPKEFPSYIIRLYYRGGCSWEWEHRNANGEIFAQGTVVDCDLADSDMIPFMLEWR